MCSLLRRHHDRPRPRRAAALPVARGAEGLLPCTARPHPRPHVAVGAPTSGGTPYLARLLE